MTANTMQIHPLCLSITPAHLEREFWSQRHVVSQLMNLDRFAFVISTLNLYSGWKAAGAMESAPAIRAIMQGCCLLFLILSSAQQLLMRQQPGWYLQHRPTILLATRIVRGGWMVAMFLLCSEADIVAYFVTRKLENSMSQELVVLQLTLMLSLIFLAQCLIWPLPFKRALLLQLLYVVTGLFSMNNVKCIVNYPELAAGTRQLCHWIQYGIDAMSECLTACHVELLAGPAAMHDSSSSSSIGDDTSSGSNLGQAIYSDRCPEKVVCFIIWTCGFVLPVYILYLREFAQKQQFLQRKSWQTQHGDDDVTALRHQRQQQQQPELGTVLNLGPLVHGAVLALLLIASAMCCDLLLTVLPPPACGDDM